MSVNLGIHRPLPDPQFASDVYATIVSLAVRLMVSDLGPKDPALGTAAQSAACAGFAEVGQPSVDWSGVDHETMTVEDDEGSAPDEGPRARPLNKFFLFRSALVKAIRTLAPQLQQLGYGFDTHMLKQHMLSKIAGRVWHLAKDLEVIRIAYTEAARREQGGGIDGRESQVPRLEPS